MATESNIAEFDKTQGLKREQSFNYGNLMEKIETKNNNFSVVYSNSAILNKIVQDVHEIKHFLNVNHLN